MKFKKINPLRMARAVYARKKKPLTFAKAKSEVARAELSTKIFFTATKLLNKYQFFENGKMVPGRMTLAGRHKLILEVMRLVEPNKKLRQIILNPTITDSQRATLYKGYLSKKYGSEEILLAKLLENKLRTVTSPDKINSLTKEFIKQQNMP